MPNYSAMITVLEDELSKAIEERDTLDARINALLTAIESVKSLAERLDESYEEIVQPPIPEDAGFTERVRGLLQMNAAKSFTPVEIRDILMEFDKNADPKVTLIHAHNTLKRMHKQGELEEVNRADGKGYRWASVMAKDRMTQIKRSQLSSRDALHRVLRGEKL